jgi:hypothetical protein
MVDMRPMLLGATLALLIGCSRAPQGEKAVLGEWVTVATSAGHYDGVMQLDANGTFREEDKFRKSSDTQKVEGSYTFTSKPSGGVVSLTVLKLDGKAVPHGGPPIELNFDSKEQILSNLFPGVIYARRAEADRVKRKLGLE